MRMSSTYTGIYVQDPLLAFLPSELTFHFDLSLSSGSWTYMMVYVDDILIASAETYATSATGKFLESIYQMNDFG